MRVGELLVPCWGAVSLWKETLPRQQSIQMDRAIKRAHNSHNRGSLLYEPSLDTSSWARIVYIQTFFQFIIQEASKSMASLLSLSPSPIISTHLSAVTACLPNVGQSVPWICNLSVFIIHKPVLSTSWITWSSLLRYTAWDTISCIEITHSVTRMNIKCEECGRKMMGGGVVVGGRENLVKTCNQLTTCCVWDEGHSFTNAVLTSQWCPCCSHPFTQIHN